MKLSGRPSWRSIHSYRRRRGGPGPGFSSLTRPISGRTLSCGASRWLRESRPPVFTGQALVDSSSPSYGEKASYYSAVCLETGEVEWMELEGNSNSETSAVFLRQLRERHAGPLNVIWDNAPAHRGESVREYLRALGLGLRLINPRLHGGRLCRVTARTSTPMSRSGAGRERKPPETWAWGPSPVAGKGRKPPRLAVQPARGGETALPHRPAIKGRRASAGFPDPFPTHGKCTSHLGFGLVFGGYVTTTKLVVIPVQLTGVHLTP